MTMRTQDAQAGGLLRSATRLDSSRKTTANAARPISQPAKKDRPVGRGRGVCNTSTAGMIDSGEKATTKASGMSSVSTVELYVLTGVVTAGFPIGAIAAKFHVEGLRVGVVGGLKADIGDRVRTLHLDGVDGDLGGPVGLPARI